jgi:hypothetical protein
VTFDRALVMIALAIGANVLMLPVVLLKAVPPTRAVMGVQWALMALAVGLITAAALMAAQVLLSPKP